MSLKAVLNGVVIAALVVCAASFAWARHVSARSTLVSPIDRTVALAGAPGIGASTAPFAIVEYSDFQCPYCGEFARTTFPELKRRVIDTGRARLVFRQFPLTSIHPFAIEAASAAMCAGDQGRFWEMHDSLFADQEHLDRQSVVDRARRLGLSEPAFSTCVDGVLLRVQADRQTGSQLQVQGTPTFLIARAAKDGSVTVVDVLSGSVDVSTFERSLDKAAMPVRGK
jgi:protein-disulfide isomerase